jgi:hypothetical protein
VEESYLIALDPEDEDPDFGNELAAKMQEIREELAGPSPVYAVELAAEKAAIAWLEHYVCELVATRALREGRPVSRTLERRLYWTDKRYSHSLITVERIKRLSRPRGLSLDHLNSGAN